jgi:hypothetical protein
LQSGESKLQLVGFLDVGMSNVYSPVEKGRFSEDDILFVGFVALCSKFYTLKPHKVHHASAVGEVGNETFLTTLSNSLETENLALKLDIWHVAVDLADAIDAAAVHIFVGIVADEVAHGKYLQLLVQDVGPLWTYAGDIFYVS